MLKHLTTILVVLLLASTASAQAIRSLPSEFPCTEKALLMDGHDVVGRTMAEVTNVMCECQPFARGHDIVVYLEHDEEVNATTVFSFSNGDHYQTSITLSYINEENEMDADVKRLIRHLDDLYGDYTGLIQLQTTYENEESKLRSSYAWVTNYSYLQLDIGRDDVKMVRVYKQKR